MWITKLIFSDVCISAKIFKTDSDRKKRDGKVLRLHDIVAEIRLTFT